MAEAGHGRQSRQGPDLFVEFGRHETVGQVLLQQLITLVQEGSLQPGDKLPPERELARLLGISRPSVRQALSALSLIGLVESRQGSGTYLAENLDQLPLEPFVYRLLLNRGSFDELMEVRRLIEPYVAAQAAKRGTDEQMREIQEAFDAYTADVEGADEIAEAHSGTAWHQAIARASGNQTFVVLLAGLNDLVDAAGRLLGSLTRGASLESHRQITEAVVGRDAKRAERAMREHLRDVATRLHAVTADTADT
jgi:GntR family transcriptional repressor for pyruvate dehydrogenase complex